MPEFRNTRTADASEPNRPADLRSESSGGRLVAEFLETDNPDFSLADALSGIAHLSPSETRALLGTAFALPKSDPYRARMLQALLTQLAATSPLEALELADQIDSLRDNEQARRAILEVWGKTNPDAALAWAHTALANEPSNLRQAQMLAILRGFAETDPLRAFRYANSLDDSTGAAQREKHRMLAEVIRTQIQNGGLFAARATIEAMHDGTTKDSALRQMVSAWAAFDPGSAAAYINAMGADAPTELKRTLIEQWAESDPAAAAAWLSRLPEDDPAVARSTAEIIRHWTRYDLNASAEWLNTLPASPELDRAVASYTFRAAQEDPQNAMSWAESITNGRMRTAMMQRVAATWRTENPEAFENYLRGSEFSDEQKEALRSAQSRGGWGDRGFR